MSSCCDKPGPSAITADSTRTLTVALAGNPNSGKTTIFNALTGLRQKVANYAGVTVEKKTGRCKLAGGRWIDVIDLPGTYSLVSRSPDEHVAMEVLRGLQPGTPTPDIVIVVVDASNLQRNLYLVSQLIELGRPMVVALNMMDIARRRGIHVSAESLERQLGVPVVPVVGHRREGIDDLKAAVLKARVAPLPDWPLPEVIKRELHAVRTGLSEIHPNLDRSQAIAERLLIGDHAGDLESILSDQRVSSLLSSSRSRMAALGLDPMQADIEAHYRWIEGVASSSLATAEELAAMGTATDRVLPDETPAQKTLTERIDRVLIHRVWGLVLFLLIMAGLFVALFWLAAPVMEGIEAGIKWLGVRSTKSLGDGPIKALINDGIFAGVGAVVVFVPQIALLFLFLAILEDSGYLARAAFLMDRLLAKVGLHGKSFIPLLSSFACAIPGIMATRTIEDRRDRLATIFVAPFMSCSARLPVYTLLIGTFFVAAGPWGQAGIMLALYVLGVVIAAGTAFIFRRTLLKGRSAAFILELPTYKIPQWQQVLRQVFTHTWAFLYRAGTIIFCISVILWAMSYYPRLPQPTIASIEQRVAQQNASAPAEDVTAATELAVAQAQSEHSISGRIGHFIEPAIRPLGYDWKMGIGLVSAFAAREVFNTAIAVIYSAKDPEDDPLQIREAIVADKYPDGRPVWTPLVAISLLVWFVIAMQCMSTLAIVRRETRSWRWPIFMLIYMNALAYLICLVIYQVGSRIIA